MLILALDTSGRLGSAALNRDGEGLAFVKKDSELKHSRTILPVCMDMLAGVGVGLNEVDVFAATIGPGSFTGIRIGVAAVKGFAWPGRKPCAAVSSLMSAAYAAGGDEKWVCSLITARQDEFYFCLYERSGGALLPRTEEGAAGTADIVSRLGALRGPVRLAGDGAGEFLELSGLALPHDGEWQDALASAACAYQMAKAGMLTDCFALTPSYLKLSQAERLMKG